MQNWLEAEAKMAHAGPNNHSDIAADFRKRFWISLALTLPILVLSPMLQTLVGLREAIRFPGDLYVLFGLSSAVFWYGGWPFLKGFFEEFKSRRLELRSVVILLGRLVPYSFRPWASQCSRLRFRRFESHALVRLR